MKIEIYVQARMGSTRLPGKVLKEVIGRPLLSYQWERIQRSKKANSCVLLTTTHHSDDVIIDFCQKNKIEVYRGSEDDVLSRYYETAKKRKPDTIVRITADCPLIDPALIDNVIEVYENEYPKYDYVSNVIERTFPRGMEVEVFSFQALEKAYHLAAGIPEREHVTLHMYRHPEQFSLKNIYSPIDLSKYRWTVDTLDDFALIKLLMEHLYPSNPKFTLQDIVNLIRIHPEWSLINAHVIQKNT